MEKPAKTKNLGRRRGHAKSTQNIINGNGEDHRRLYNTLTLKPNSRDIRLLRLHPKISADGPHSLQATMRVVSLAQTTWLPMRNPIEFSALSYVWGENDGHGFGYTINCNGCNIEITQNCYDALSRLRLICLEIWVDSICINQRDLSERGEQVKLMGEIYNQASTVFIWLSSKDPPKSNDRYLDPEVPGMLFLRLSQEDHWSVKATRTREIQSILDDAWFQRGWTFQEFILAADPLFISDATKTSWMEIWYHVAALQDPDNEFYEEFKTGHHLRGLSSLVNLWNTIPRRRSDKIQHELRWPWREIVASAIPPSLNLLLLLITFEPSFYLDYPIFALCIALLTLFCIYSTIRGSTQAMVASFIEPYLFAILSARRHHIVPAVFALALSVSSCYCPVAVLGLLRLSWHTHHTAVLIIGIPTSFVLFAQLVVIFQCGRKFLESLMNMLAPWRDLLFLVSTYPTYLASGRSHYLMLQAMAVLMKDKPLASGAIALAMRLRRVTNPRDKAYSLYGVLQAFGASLTEPDYSEETSESDVLTNFWFDLLTWQPSLLALLADAGMPPDCPGTDDWPSWLPRWDAQTSCNWVPDSLVFETIRPQTFSRLRCWGFPFYRRQKRELRVWGRSIDEIDTCFVLPLEDEVGGESLRTILHWVSKAIQVFRESRYVSGLRNDSHALAPLLGGLLLTTPSNDQAVVFQPKQVSSKWCHVLFEYLNPVVFPMKPTQTPYILTRRDAEQVRIKLEGHDAAKELAQFQEAIEQHLRGKRLLFITKNGRFGTGSLGIRTGDEIYFLSGVGVPMCLRKRDGGDKQVVVGAAMMNQNRPDEIWDGKFSPIELV